MQNIESYNNYKIIENLGDPPSVTPSLSYSSSSVMITLTNSPSRSSAPPAPPIPPPERPPYLPICAPEIPIYVPPSTSYQSCGPGFIGVNCKCDPLTQVYSTRVTNGGKHIVSSCMPKLN
jgi:hypothetical protein